MNSCPVEELVPVTRPLLRVPARVMVVSALPLAVTSSPSE